MKFFGSYRFALILILLSGIGVIGATAIEASSESHLLAEDWIYRHPLFQCLLAGYFINILLSAFSRYPFKKRHVPFLITHLGLLMIISGVFIKTHLGIQGHLHLIEGAETDILTHPHTPALFVEQRFPQKKISIPLNQMELIAYYPHAEEKYQFWNNAPPYASIERKSDETVILSSKTLEGETLAFHFNPYKLTEWVSYDQGYLGYAVQAKVPSITEKEQLQYDAWLLDHFEKELKNGLNSSLCPPLELMRQASSYIDFTKSCMKYLKNWDRAGTWLYDVPYPALIDWSKISDSSRNALYWISELFDEEHFLENLERKGWPLVKSLKGISDPYLRYETWMEQIFSIQDQLPPPASNLNTARMLSAYLRLYSIHYSLLPKPPYPEKTDSILLESPLTHLILPKDPPAKKEDRRPGITFSFAKEELSLLYDPEKTGLKWPAGTGRHLLRFQDHEEELPYKVRLHRALQIDHPGTKQAASYECTLTLTDKRSGIQNPCRLSMNQVHETQDGYRFYLAGIGTIDNYGVHSLQLVVSRDPAKMFLTYPGSLLVALGIIGLFFYRRRE